MSFNSALLATASLSQLVALYNLHTPSTPVKAFRDKPTALARVQSMAVQASLQAVEVDGKVALAKPAAPTGTPVRNGLAKTLNDFVAPAKKPARAKAAKPAKAAAAPKAPGAQRGPKPTFGETDVITVLAEKNPKREGAANYKRFALYRTGMTVKEFLDGAHKLQPEFGRGRWRGDLEWDVRYGFIKVEPAKTSNEAKAA